MQWLASTAAGHLSQTNTICCEDCYICYIQKCLGKVWVVFVDFAESLRGGPWIEISMGVVLLYSQGLDSKNLLGTVCRVFQATMRYTPSQMYTQKPWTWAVYVLRDKTFASQNLFKTIALQRKRSILPQLHGHKTPQLEMEKSVVHCQ